jgi:pantetheine-phosphate adenylyltransferase
MKKCIYPGSFDPITNGHLDIITRGSAMYDELIVCVLINTSKKACFTLDERVKMIEASVAHLDNVRVEKFDGLLVDYAKDVGATNILRGLRAVSDFEYEFAIAAMNQHLDEYIETVFLMTRQLKTRYIIINKAALIATTKMTVIDLISVITCCPLPLSLA